MLKTKFFLKQTLILSEHMSCVKNIYWGQKKPKKVKTKIQSKDKIVRAIHIIIREFFIATTIWNIKVMVMETKPRHFQNT